MPPARKIPRKFSDSITRTLSKKIVRPICANLRGGNLTTVIIMTWYNKKTRFHFSTVKLSVKSPFGSIFWLSVRPDLGPRCQTTHGLRPPLCVHGNKKGWMISSVASLHWIPVSTVSTGGWRTSFHCRMKLTPPGKKQWFGWISIKLTDTFWGWGPGKFQKNTSLTSWAGVWTLSLWAQQEPGCLTKMGNLGPGPFFTTHGGGGVKPTGWKTAAVLAEPLNYAENGSNPRIYQMLENVGKSSRNVHNQQGKKLRHYLRHTSYPPPPIPRYESGTSQNVRPLLQVLGCHRPKFLIKKFVSTMQKATKNWRLRRQITYFFLQISPMAHFFLKKRYIWK